VREPKARKVLHVSLALDELADEQRRGNLAEFVTYVDERKNKPLTAVKDGGRITFADNARLADAVAYAFDYLDRERRVPRGPAPAHYKDEHELIVNMRPVDRDHAIADDDFVVIANVMPYARKLETGHAGPRGNRSPEYRVYKRLVASMRRKFGKGLNVQYRQMALPGHVVGALVPRRPELQFLAREYPMLVFGRSKPGQHEQRRTFPGGRFVARSQLDATRFSI
jgi:hypothetical protein